MKKHKGRYRVSSFINGEREERYFTKREDALSWKAQKKREQELHRAGLARPETGTLLIDYASRWLKKRMKSHPQSTWAGEEAKLRMRILPRFGALPIVTIQTQHWTEFFDSLIEEGLSPAARNRHRALVGKIYADAIKDQIAVFNPIRNTSALLERKDGFNYLKDSEEIRKFLTSAKARDPIFFRLALVMLNTGLRVAEALALDREDLQVKTRSIHVSKILERVTGKVVRRTKSKSSRIVPMNDTVAGLVKGLPAGWVFPGEPGAPRSYWWARDHVEAVCNEIGITNFSLQSMRHTFASHFLMCGGTKSELKEILGHSSEAVTERYSHMAEEHLRRRINVVQMQLGTREKRGKSVS